MKKNLLFLLLGMLLTACTQNPNVIEQDLGQKWTLTGDTLAIDLSVSVPSVVQENLFDAGLIPHPYLGVVEEELLWISDHPWTYTTHFNVDPKFLKKDVVELVFEGIDTYASVTLNGKKLFDADNQFRIWKLYEQHQPRLPEKYAVSRKAPYQHGWDWAPKYKNVGIWKPVKLQAWSDARLENAYVVTETVNAEQARLALHLDVATVPKHADVRDYRVATGLEALLGHLYLLGEDERIGELMRLALQIEPEKEPES